MVRRPVSYFLSFLYLYSYCTLLPAVLSFRLHHLITLLISSLSIRQRDRSHLQSPLISTCLFSVCAALQVRSLICFLVFEFNIWLWISLFSVCAALQRFNTSVKSANLFCTADHSKPRLLNDGQQQQVKKKWRTRKSLGSKNLVFLTF